MPNTEPAQDSLAVIELVRRLGEEAGLCEVVPAGCITVGRAGEALAPLAELAGAGVRLFTDDGNGVQDPLLMRRALEYARGLDVTLAQHCEVSRLTEGAVMHEGACCSHLGLPGWPSIAEELMVFRDIELARLTGARLHLLHLSTARSVELVRAAKADGLPVTAEAAPHHFSLTDSQLQSFDPVYKVNPPLRTPGDVAAIKQGLRDGTIDAIATDHAPHPVEAKEQPLDQAPPGMLGLETALPLALGELDLDLPEVVALLSWRPAAIARLERPPWRPDPTGAPGEPDRVRSLADLAGHPGCSRLAGAATRRTPDAACRARCATRCSAATRSWSTEMPADESTCSRVHDHAARLRHAPASEDRPVTVREAALVLADGSVFEGEAIGADPPGGVASGEVVFNTVLAGYQEVLTDPSYAGQIITFTAPHIGNYGVNRTDMESSRPFCRGMIVRELSRRRSNHRADDDLDSLLRRFGVPAIAGIDTRRLTRVLRDTGAMAGAFGTAGEASLKAAAASRARHRRRRPRRRGHVLRALRRRTVKAVSASSPTTSASRPRSCASSRRSARWRSSPPRPRRPMCWPAVLTGCSSPTDRAIRRWCRTRSRRSAGWSVRCRSSASASGTRSSAVPSAARTFKLPFGHHGGNHPVRNLRTGQVEITSQNHNFCVDPDSLAGRAELTHLNLNDQTNEGMRVLDAPAFSVQYHPEAGPGPHDARYLFAEFAELIEATGGRR